MIESQSVRCPMEMAMRLLLVLATILVPATARAAATCSPVSNDALILASPDEADIHPDWSDGSYVGLSWSLDLLGDERGAGGRHYLYGDLIDPRGNVVNEGVYVIDLEWECDPAQ